MGQCLIMFRSLTYAQAAMRTLERGGVFVQLVRAPHEISGSGCGYGLRVSEQHLGACLELLRRKNRPIGKIYKYLSDGTLQEAHP